MAKRVFLSATWEYLALFNYEVDAAMLQRHIPPGTEIDYWQGKAMVSVVGFLFNNTRVLGVKWPFHVHFKEVNLRYYIKYNNDGEMRRGVGFVSEIVPKHVIAYMANGLYNERYSAMPMAHDLNIDTEKISAMYKWKLKNRWNHMQVDALNNPQDVQPGTEEDFILEHYWGYNALNATTTIEYGVEHPRWQIYPVTGYDIDADIEKLYGKDFVPFIQNVAPRSVFLAKGSDIIVRRPRRLIIPGS